MKYNPDGDDVMKRDWDTLIILDACRYDYFNEAIDMPGDLEIVTSRGSTSTEFMRGNFSNKQLHDVVYISANGFYGQLRNEIGSEVYKHIQLYTEEWRDEYGITTNPKTVTQEAIKAHQEYPNKRLIVHYLQPHQPYLGPYGREQFDFGGDLRETINRSGVSIDDVRMAYRENLEFVLDEAKNLISEIDGKTIITSDHGEMLGERIGPFRFFGHFGGVYREELVKVPWFTVDFDGRRDIIVEEPETTSNIDQELIEQNLRALGYKA